MKLFGGNKYPDDLLASQATTAVTHDPLISDPGSVVVTSKHGVVTISGTVRQPQERERIEGLVRSAITTMGLKHHADRQRTQGAADRRLATPAHHPLTTPPPPCYATPHKGNEGDMLQHPRDAQRAGHRLLRRHAVRPAATPLQRHPRAGPRTIGPADPVKAPGAPVTAHHEAPTRKGRRKPWWHHEGVYQALVHIVDEGFFVPGSPPSTSPTHNLVGRASHGFTQRTSQ